MRKILNLLFSFLFIVNLVSVFAQENKGFFAVPMQQTTDIPKSQLNSGRFELEQNSPNPFAEFSQIEYTNPVQGFVEFKIVNLIGKEVYHRVLEAESGRNAIRLEGADFTPGVYIYSLSNGTQTITRRMVISKK